jgi:hypothetical protein
MIWLSDALDFSVLTSCMLSMAFNPNGVAALSRPRKLAAGRKAREDSLKQRRQNSGQFLQRVRVAEQVQQPAEERQVTDERQPQFEDGVSAGGKDAVGPLPAN